MGLPSWSDKLIGEVVRLLLDAYYEPRFSGKSHGFRPRRGCHTALSEVVDKWSGTTWFVEGDISDCFGSFDHEVMLATLAEKIHDNRFLRLIKQMLKAGYLEDWEWNATHSGAPQGGVASPVLSNVYLDRLDKFVETILIPEYTRGEKRERNPAYSEVVNAIKRARRSGDRAEVRELRKQLRSLPAGNPRDPGFRRLHYVRYADDTLLGFIGPKAEAKEIKQRLAQFLRDDLKLELAEEKTLITHGRTQAARFLGYEITTQHGDHVIRRGHRGVNGTIALRVPLDVIKAKCRPYLTHGKPGYRPQLKNRDDLAIISTYGAEYRGLVQYYLLAGDVWRLYRVRWVMETSMLKTLAAKHRSTVTTMARKHKTTIRTPHGPRTCFQTSTERPGKTPRTARFGEIVLKRQKKTVLHDRLPVPSTVRKELVTRLRLGRCELCDQRTNVEVHQIGKLADLVTPGRPQPAWAQLMAKRRRKTLVVCQPCHDTIHARQPTATTTE